MKTPIQKKKKKTDKKIVLATCFLFIFSEGGE